MFMNYRRIRGLTLMTRILFRGWNLLVAGGAFEQEMQRRILWLCWEWLEIPPFLSIFGSLFNRNILLYKWEICHGQVWLRQLVNVCVDIAPACSKVFFSDRGPLKSAASNPSNHLGLRKNQLSLGEVNLPLASWIWTVCCWKKSPKRGLNLPKT